MKCLIFLLLLLVNPISFLLAQNGKVGKMRDKEITIIKDKVFTYKAIETCNKRYNYSGDTIGYFIGIKIPDLVADTTNVFEPLYIGCSYGWNRIFSKYSNEDRITILEELLQYEDDTDLSGKKVIRYGFADANTPKPKTKSYTIQTEALYLITLLTMSESAMTYSPFPVLINKSTGKEITNDQKEIKRVFRIYKRWVKENKKKGFVDFEPPLNNSKYKWYKGLDYYPNYKIDRMYSTGLNIGVGQD
ncbi:MULTISPECIES: hypothetical protein [unclassified Dysgonomonas]|uniref:hypothetical protein n=1 Tax=unclassified Dysgonomonas TaxID=2630389 RepID=UPI0024748841|nr:MULTISPECIES: hypothetical protein [unclassified Dysgonomonas]